MDENKPAMVEPPVPGARSLGERFKRFPWWAWALAAILVAAVVEWLFPEWTAFWRACIKAGYTDAQGALGIVQGITGLATCFLVLAYRKKWAGIQATWEGALVKAGLWILGGSFVLAVVLIEPFAQHQSDKAEADHQKVQIGQLKTQIEDGMPKLVGRIDQVGWGQIPNDPVKGFPLLLIATIKNLGSPSVVERYSVTILFNGQKEIEAQNYIIPELGIAWGDRVRYKPTDGLYNKAISTPVARGGQVTGVLLLQVPVDMAAMQNPGNLIRLKFSDVTGKEYQCEYRTTGVDLPGDVYIPGTSAPEKMIK